MEKQTIQRLEQRITIPLEHFWGERKRDPKLETRKGLKQAASEKAQKTSFIHSPKHPFCFLIELKVPDGKKHGINSKETTALFIFQLLHTCFWISSEYGHPITEYRNIFNKLLHDISI